VLFPGTIRDNLVMWDDSVDDDAVRRAASDACILSTVLARPDGFHARVTGQDSGFSGGEMQRLSIARALVGDPAILVLDEATSALDPVVEAEVDANLRRRGCTALIVAHRLSTVRDADEILVIEDGRVIQRGAYEDIKHHGFFSELING
jgi:ABC-type multidrug transport system fused ATPase/permease subunit